jgi:predicted nucleotidyltransferase
LVADLAGGPVPAVPAVLIERIIQHYDPIEVILFGSHARGEAGPDSDWDLLVVVDDDTPPEKLRLRYAYQAIAGTRIAADVVPVRASRFRERSSVVNTLSNWAAVEGKVVYARA